MIASLSDLIAPLDAGTFLSEYWTRTPYALHRRQPRAYSSLPTRPDFEHLAYALTNPKDGWFSIVKTVARRADEDMLTEEGLLNLSAAYSAYAEGSSLLLNQVQRRHKATGVLCRHLEHDLTSRGVYLSRHIGANAYLSPPDSQGFKIHYDPHDVLILQLEGRKHWRLYDFTSQRWPRQAPNHPTPAEEAGEPRAALTVEEGDLLYIPRGLLHDAFTTDSHSLHLTLSIETITMADLIEVLLSQCDPAGRDLPSGIMSDTLRADRLVQSLKPLFEDMCTTGEVNRAFRALEARLLANIDPLPGVGFDAADAARHITPQTWLTHRQGNFGHVEVDGDEVVLHLPGTAMRAGRTMEAAFRYVLCQAPIRALDLPTEGSQQDKVQFLAALVERGFLVPQNLARSS